MRNYSQPTLSGASNLQRNSKTADTNNKCKTKWFKKNFIVRRNINGLSTDIQHLGMSSS